MNLSTSRRDFPSLSRSHDDRPLVFFDGAAGTQVPRVVIDAISSYYETSNANSGGSFITSEETDVMVHDTREHLAAMFNAPSAETISFGQNMTTLTFLLSKALVKTMKPGDEIIITQLDHEANRGPWLALREDGIVIHEAAMRQDGRLDYDDLEAKISSRTRLIALGMASNAIGTVNDVARVREASRRAGAQLFLDAVHYAPHFSIDVEALDPDFLICSAYKFYGPHVGILYCREGLLDTLETSRLVTASQAAPERIETGTLNYAAIAGVRAAVRYIESWGEGSSLRERLVDAFRRIGSHERALAVRYWEGIAGIAEAERWGPDFSDAQRAPTVSITLKNLRSDELARRLAARGINSWGGHFYAKRAVERLGVEARGGLLRSGFFIYNTEDEVDRLLAELETLAR